MKKSELKEYIKTRIRETLYAGPRAIEKAKADPNYNSVKDKAAIDKELQSGGAVELEEILRTGEYVSFKQNNINRYGKIISIKDNIAKVEYEFSGEDIRGDIPLKMLKKIDTSDFNPGLNEILRTGEYVTFSKNGMERYGKIVTVGTKTAEVEYEIHSEFVKDDIPLELLKKTNTNDFSEIDEMALTATTYKVSPDFKELAKNIKTGGPISPGKLGDVLEFLEGKETTTGPAIAAGVGFPGQMPRIYPIFAALISKGALISTKESKIVDVPDTPENEKVKTDKEYDAEETPSTEVPEIPTGSESTQEFIKANAAMIDIIIKSYKNSRGRIYNLDEKDEKNIDFQDYVKTLDKSQDANFERYEQESNKLAELIKKLDPSTQDEVIEALKTKFTAAGTKNIITLLLSKVGKNPKPGSDKELEDVDFEDELPPEEKLDEIQLDGIVLIREAKRLQKLAKIIK